MGDTEIYCQIGTITHLFKMPTDFKTKITSFYKWKFLKILDSQTPSVMIYCRISFSLY